MINFKRIRTSAMFREYLAFFIVILVVSFIIMGAALGVSVRSYWEDQKLEILKDNADKISDSVSQLIETEYARNNPEYTVLNICSLLVNASRDVSSSEDNPSADFFICNNKGEVIYCQEMCREGMELFTGDCIIHRKINLPNDILKTLDTQAFSGISTLNDTLTEKQFIYAARIEFKNENAGIIVGMQRVSSEFRPYIRTLLQMFSVAVLITLAIALIAVYIMSYALTKPMRQMLEATKSYAEGDFSKRVTVRGNNEMTELSVAFNSMAKALASLESSRRSFVANVSHELKTPMTTIGGFIDGILDGTISEEKQSYYLSIVSDEVKRLSRLVTGMLNMSKIEAGELGLKCKEFDICEMIFRTMLGFEQIIESKGLRITGLENMTPTMVWGDEDMLTQVVYNLIDNAVKFTPDSGEIHFDVLCDGQKAYVTIRNSGKGISSEDLQNVFERFYKVDKSRSYDVKGAGLGLYLVKSIVEMHKGKVTAKSVENSYTEFSFWIPLEKGKK